MTDVHEQETSGRDRHQGPPFLDFSCADRLQDAIEDATGADLGRRLIVDLQGCRFVDSSGLRALVRIRERYGHRLAIVAQKEGYLRRIVEIAELAKVLDLCETLAGAFRSVPPAD